MTQSQSGANGPDSPLLDQEKSALVGVIVSIIIGAPALVLFVVNFINLGGTLIPLIAIAYFVGAVVQYWMSHAYKDGLTLKGLGKMASWPVDIYQAVRAGGRKGASAAWSRPASSDDDTPFMSERAALWSGVGATVVVALLAFYGIGMLIGALGSLIWVCVFGYILGAIGYFWQQKLHKDGLTAAKLLTMVVWPVDYLRRAYKGFKARVRNI